MIGHASAGEPSSSVRLACALFIALFFSMLGSEPCGAKDAGLH